MTLSIEELKAFESNPTDNFLTRGQMMDVVRELIAIREQHGKPVAMDALRDAVAEMTGGLPMEWQEGNDKGHHAVPFINFNSLHRIVAKFTAPQKPVVLPEKSLNDYNRYWIDYQDTVAAIESAGGKVA